MTEEAVEIRVSRRQGHSIGEIARMLDVSRNAVRRYLCRQGLPHSARVWRMIVLERRAMRTTGKCSRKGSDDRDPRARCD